MEPKIGRKPNMMNLKNLLAFTAISLLASAAHAKTEMYYIHSDHLGTPQVLTDKDQQVVWRRTQTPFGETVEESGTVIQPLRFPGQYEDPETGFHYNYFRDYDPAIGRYLQSDPIGLRGDVNIYGYVTGNPLLYIDPLGLFRNGSVAGHFGFSQAQLDQVGRTPAATSEIMNPAPLVDPVSAYGEAYVEAAKHVPFLAPLSKPAQFGVATIMLYEVCTADTADEVFDILIGAALGKAVPVIMEKYIPEVSPEIRERTGIAAGAMMEW